MLKLQTPSLKTTYPFKKDKVSEKDFELVKKTAEQVIFEINI